jgi:peptide methionine sulfoxide reductase msrA/msrB
MLRWIDILKFANNGNPEPARKVIKTAEEWRALLTAEQFRITRLKGTERAHSSELCSLFEPGKYACICCETPLFDATEKFESGSGWPSFTQPLGENTIAYHKDKSLGMYRVETVCNTCDAHLGHVFPDGPEPSGLRFCINAEALKKVESTEAKAVFGGGCFWCTEAVFQQVKGVKQVRSGYSGGKIANPTYREVTSGLTGHVEVIEVVYDSSLICYKELLQIHLSTHNPTTLNKQGADWGTQYRSVIFFKNAEEKALAEQVLAEMQSAFDKPIVTELAKLEAFYVAEDYHQNYYASNPEKAYCQAVINPKLKKFRALFVEKMS